MPSVPQHEQGKGTPLPQPTPDLAPVLPGGQFPSHANIQWTGVPPRPKLGILFRTLPTGGGYHYKTYPDWTSLAQALEQLASDPEAFLAEFPVPKRELPSPKPTLTLADLGL